MSKAADDAPKVLVTAGASGIGRCIALAFRDAGYRVFVCDIDRAALDALFADAGDVTGFEADVANPDHVETVFAEIDKAPGPFAVLVNNAGIAGPTAPVQDIDTTGWRQTLAVNLFRSSRTRAGAASLTSRQTRPCSDSRTGFRMQPANGG
jgi:NAD(P)-dependent dehydrogenase (short-subunit alcohol dehydrogenase family)